MRLSFDRVKATTRDATAPEGFKQPGLWKSIDWKLMAALVLPLSLDTLDYTVVATAQSHIASEFNALNLQSYIGTSYLLTTTVFLPLFATVADIYGRYFSIQMSLFLFLVGSALSTGAVNMLMVLIGRGIAGIGAAGLLTVVRTILSDTKSLDGNNVQQSAMMLLYVIPFSTGPLIGGFLVTVNFRWIFAISLPCAAFAMVLCYLLLRSRVRDAMSFDDLSSASQTDTWISKLVYMDWIATFLFVSGGILILLALNWGPDDNWKSMRTIMNLVIGAILVSLCIAWEIILERKRGSTTGVSGVFRAYPMIPLEMFTSVDMCVVQFGSFASGIVVMVMFYFVPIFMTIVTGLPASQAGIRLLYFIPGLGIGSLISIYMIKRLRQPIYPIVLGSAVITVSLGLIQMAMEMNVQRLVDVLIAMVGVGLDLIFGPLVIQARFIKPDHIAISNAMLLFFRAFGGTFGLAQCFTVMNAIVGSYITGVIESRKISGPDLATLAALRSSGGLKSIQTLDGLPNSVQIVVKEAFREAVRWSFISLIPWAGVATISSLFLSKIEDTDAEMTEGHASTDSVNTTDASHHGEK